MSVQILSVKSIKSALIVASWACQQDNCPFIAYVYRAFSQDLEMHFIIQCAHVFPTGKRLGVTKTKTKTPVSIRFTCWKGKLLIFGLYPSFQGKDIYNRNSLNYPSTIT